MRISMKTIHSLAMAVAALALLAGAVHAGYPEKPVNLGSAGKYAILSKSGISVNSPSMIVGNLGVSPAAATYITGFGLTLDGSGTFATAAQVDGRIYAASYAAPTPTLLTTEIGDMETAYAEAAGRKLPDETELGSGNIGGMTLAPGLYKWSSGVSINADVTLAGTASDVWIFQIEGNLTLASATAIHLGGGAQAMNVFWQVAGGAGAVIDTTAHFEGILLTATKIDLLTGASANGRLLAQTAVTMDQNEVAEPVPPGPAAANDFDGDGKSDLTVYEPATGIWDLLFSADVAPWISPWGGQSMLPVPADYDGDGKTDFALYQRTTGYWYILYSSGGSEKIAFGGIDKVPLPGDYDGDGRADLALYSAAEARWYFHCTTEGNSVVSFGGASMIPVPADYDGDGVTDVAVYRPANGMWYIVYSGGGSLVKAYGWAGTVPVPGDYDGDGRADIAVLSRATSKWCILFSGGGGEIVEFGYKTMTPVPTDYDGDGVTDIAMYHQASGTWYIRESATGRQRKIVHGGPGKIPALLYPLIQAWFGLP